MQLPYENEGHRASGRPFECRVFREVYSGTDAIIPGQVERAVRKRDKAGP